jgi:hypothetical protein
MSNPLMRGMPGFSHANYQPNVGTVVQPGANVIGSPQSFPAHQANSGAAGFQIQYNPLDYSGFQGSPIAK